MHRAPQELRTYFTTFSTADRRHLFQVHATASLMVATLDDYRSQGRFALHAYVVMPDHVHLLLTPATDISFEKALQYIRGGFSFRLKSRLDVWERGHFDKRVPGREAFEACISYIHQNPVKAGLVRTDVEYLFSSAGRIAELDPRPVWMASASAGAEAQLDDNGSSAG
jgi:putative transposase